jgi:uncharacterized protein YecE (DUF72 family)
MASHEGSHRVGAPRIRVGTAGWSIGASLAGHFPAGGSALERYAARLDAVEINSSFYRSHRPSTYARWHDSVPSTFRFSVKLPRTVTHECRLKNAEIFVERFLYEVSHLGDKLGVLLVQLPPSLHFEETIALHFLELLRTRSKVSIVCEPRHPSWFGDLALRELEGQDISIVVADPPPCSAAADLSVAKRRVVYVRLHGSPRIYHSTYERDTLRSFARELLLARDEAWCILDNTASGAALGNAMDLMSMLA